MSPEFSFPTVMVGIEILLCSPPAIAGGLGDTPPVAAFPCECWMPSGFRKFVLSSAETIPRTRQDWSAKPSSKEGHTARWSFEATRKIHEGRLLAATARGVLGLSGLHVPRLCVHL